MKAEVRWVVRVPHKTVVRRQGPASWGWRWGWGYQCRDCYASMPAVFSWQAAFDYAYRHSQVSSRATTALDWAETGTMSR